MENFNPLKCFYDRNYPIVFSKFQLNEILRALSCFRLTLPKEQVLVLDECIHIIELHLEYIKRYDSSFNCSSVKYVKD